MAKLEVAARRKVLIWEDARAAAQFVTIFEMQITTIKVRNSKSTCRIPVGNSVLRA